jgi:hypothetical protein
MADFFVFYTLDAPTADLALSLESMNGIQILSGICSVWIVRTESTAPVLSKRLGPFVGHGGNLFVVEIADASAWQKGNVVPLDELRKRLGG